MQSTDSLRVEQLQEPRITQKGKLGPNCMRCYVDGPSNTLKAVL